MKFRILITSMLVTKCVRDYFEILVADNIEKVGDITKKKVTVMLAT